MPRTLPWQVKTESRGSSASSSPGPRGKSLKSRSSAAADLRGQNRSTSPPLEPPQEEYMREGLENDDIYIMVEDELLATAGSFTRHLHQAEYERQKKLAKIRNAGAIGDLARPTDPRAKMSVETKKNIAAGAASAKHKAALNQIKDSAGRPPVDSELEEDEDNDEDDDDDPWIGTQLHTLMTSPRRSRSLVGLQGVKSNTRAALGFSNSASRRADRNTSPTVRRGYTAPRQPQPPSGDVDDETSSGDDDELGASSKLRDSALSDPSPSTTGTSATNRPSKVSESTRKTTFKKSRTPTTSPSTTTRQQPSSKPANTSRMARLFDEFDDEPGLVFKAEKAAPKKDVLKRSAPEASSNKTREQDQKSRRDRLNQVPTFL